MPNPLSTAWSYLTSPHPAVRQIERMDRPPLETKFTPASAEVNWEYVQNLMVTYGSSPPNAGDGNSAVFACLMALALGSIEPPLQVWQEDEPGERNPLMDHPLTQRLKHPNTFHRPRELWFWKTWVQNCDGNAYFLKVRGNGKNYRDITGEVTSLWPISPTLIKPWADEDSKNFIDGYRRQIGPGQFQIEPIENIVHFRLGVDDRDHRLGLAPLKRLLRQVASDEAASRWMDRMLAIGGAASMIVQLDKETHVTPEQARQMATDIKAAFTGDNVGAVGVLAPGASAERYGFSPDEMDLAALHNVPEARIAAVIGVHPAIAGLNSGLAQTSNYASLEAVYTAFTKRRLALLWKFDEETINQSLLPDFETDPHVLVAYDLSEVQALQEDVTARWERVGKGFERGILTLDQTLTELGFPAMNNDIGAARRATQFGMTTDEEALAKPEPVVPPQLPQPGEDQNQLPPGKSLSWKQADLERWADVLAVLTEREQAGFTADMDRFLDRQRRAIRRAILQEGAG